MTLRRKLLYSHLFVTMLSILTVAVIAVFISTSTFEEIIEDTSTTELQTGDLLTVQTSEEENSRLNTALETALLLGLGVATVISTGIAFAISLSLSQRMVRPIRSMIKATSRIAEGHYTQRVTYRSKDEIGQLADHFNHMAASLDTIEAVRRQLLADLTHELNTPLTGIIGCVEGLQDGTIADTETSYTLIYDEALRLQRLVRDVQHLSSVEAGSDVLQREPLAANDLLQAVVAKLQVQYESKAVQLMIHYPDTSPLICGDRDRLMQVLINLLGNALQYTPSGGQVTVTVHVTDRHATFTIADTGIGLAPSELKRIFDRFYRVDKSRNRRSGGSGIGLTIAHTIVAAHEGRIWAESDGPGQGSQFYFTIPLAVA